MQRKRVLVTCMGLCLVVSMFAMAFAAENAAQVCKEEPAVVLGFIDFDTCVVRFNEGDTFATWICKVYEDRGLLEQLGYKNLGQCVKDRLQ